MSNVIKDVINVCIGNNDKDPSPIAKNLNLLGNLKGITDQYTTLLPLQLKGALLGSHSYSTVEKHSIKAYEKLGNILNSEVLAIPIEQLRSAKASVLALTECEDIKDDSEKTLTSLLHTFDDLIYAAQFENGGRAKLTSDQRQELKGTLEIVGDFMPKVDGILDEIIRAPSKNFDEMIAILDDWHERIDDLNIPDETPIDVEEALMYCQNLDVNCKDYDTLKELLDATLPKFIELYFAKTTRDKGRENLSEGYATLVGDFLPEYDFSDLYHRAEDLGEDWLESLAPYLATPLPKALTKVLRDKFVKEIKELKVADSGLIVQKLDVLKQGVMDMADDGFDYVLQKIDRIKQRVISESTELPKTLVEAFEALENLEYFLDPENEIYDPHLIEGFARLAQKALNKGIDQRSWEGAHKPFGIKMDPRVDRILTQLDACQEKLTEVLGFLRENTRPTVGDIKRLQEECHETVAHSHEALIDLRDEKCGAAAIAAYNATRIASSSAKALMNQALDTLLQNSHNFPPLLKQTIKSVVMNLKGMGPQAELNDEDVIEALYSDDDKIDNSLSLVDKAILQAKAFFAPYPAKVQCYFASQFVNGLRFVISKQPENVQAQVALNNALAKLEQVVNSEEFNQGAYLNALRSFRDGMSKDFPILSFQGINVPFSWMFLTKHHATGESIQAIRDEIDRLESLKDPEIDQMTENREGATILYSRKLELSITTKSIVEVISSILKWFGEDIHLDYQDIIEEVLGETPYPDIGATDEYLVKMNALLLEKFQAKVWEHTNTDNLGYITYALLYLLWSPMINVITYYAKEGTEQVTQYAERGFINNTNIDWKMMMPLNILQGAIHFNNEGLKEWAHSSSGSRRYNYIKERWEDPHVDGFPTAAKIKEMATDKAFNDFFPDLVNFAPSVQKASQDWIKWANRPVFEEGYDFINSLAVIGKWAINIPAQVFLYVVWLVIKVTDFIGSFVARQCAYYAIQSKGGLGIVTDKIIEKIDQIGDHESPMAHALNETLNQVLTDAIHSLETSENNPDFSEVDPLLAADEERLKEFVSYFLEFIDTHDHSSGVTKQAFKEYLDNRTLGRDINDAVKKVFVNVVVDKLNAVLQKATKKLNEPDARRDIYNKLIRNTTNSLIEKSDQLEGNAESKFVRSRNELKAKAELLLYLGLKTGIDDTINNQGLADQKKAEDFQKMFIDKLDVLTERLGDGDLDKPALEDIHREIESFIEVVQAKRKKFEETISGEVLEKLHQSIDEPMKQLERLHKTLVQCIEGHMVIEHLEMTQMRLEEIARFPSNIKQPDQDTQDELAAYQKNLAELRKTRLIIEELQQTDGESLQEIVDPLKDKLTDLEAKIETLFALSKNINSINDILTPQHNEGNLLDELLHYVGVNNSKQINSVKEKIYKFVDLMYPVSSKQIKNKINELDQTNIDTSSWRRETEALLNNLRSQFEDQSKELSELSLYQFSQELKNRINNHINICQTSASESASRLETNSKALFTHGEQLSRSITGFLTPLLLADHVITTIRNNAKRDSKNLTLDGARESLAFIDNSFDERFKDDYEEIVTLKGLYETYVESDGESVPDDFTLKLERFALVTEELSRKIINARKDISILQAHLTSLTLFKSCTRIVETIKDEGIVQKMAQARETLLIDGNYETVRLYDTIIDDLEQLQIRQQNHTHPSILKKIKEIPTDDELIKKLQSLIQFDKQGFKSELENIDVAPFMPLKHFMILIDDLVNAIDTHYDQTTKTEREKAFDSLLKRCKDQLDFYYELIDGGEDYEEEVEKLLFYEHNLVDDLIQLSSQISDMEGITSISYFKNRVPGTELLSKALAMGISTYIKETMMNSTIANGANVGTVLNCAMHDYATNKNSVINNLVDWATKPDNGAVPVDIRV